MIKNELEVLKNKILNGALHRDIDESYSGGVWDLAIKYVKEHHINDYYGLKQQDINVVTNVLYDFIYDLLEEK